MSRSRCVLASALLALLVGLLTIVLEVPAGIAFVSSGNAPKDHQSTYGYDSPSASTTPTTDVRTAAQLKRSTARTLLRVSTSSTPRHSAAKVGGAGITSVEDVLTNPSVLAGKTPSEVEAALGESPGWKVETLGRGSRKGQGWVFREYDDAGNPTGRLIRWHPGGGHHGPDPYWRLSSPQGGTRVRSDDRVRGN